MGEGLHSAPCQRVSFSLGVTAPGLLSEGVPPCFPGEVLSQRGVGPGRGTAREAALFLARRETPTEEVLLLNRQKSEVDLFENLGSSA